MAVQFDVLHPAAAEIASHVKQEHILAKRRAAHQRNLVVDDALQRVR